MPNFGFNIGVANLTLEAVRFTMPAYGVYRTAEGVAERALFVIDEKGMIAWSYCSPIAVNPG